MSTVRFTAAGGSNWKTLGAYSIVGKTGSMAAGLTAASPIFAFRWDPATAGTRAIVDRVRVSVASLATGFAAGIGYLEAVAARAYTVTDYGGTAAPTTTSATVSESRAFASEVVA